MCCGTNRAQFYNIYYIILIYIILIYYIIILYYIILYYIILYYIILYYIILYYIGQTVQIWFVLKWLKIVRVYVVIIVCVETSLVP